MKPVKHLVASSAAAGLFYLYSNSLLASLVCFLSGVFIDLDHLYDYYRNSRRLTFNARDFYYSCIDGRFEKLYLFFHSLELIFLFWILIIIFKLNLIWVAFGVGITLHLIQDIVGNSLFAYSYFLVYRVYKGFRTEFFFKNAL